MWCEKLNCNPKALSPVRYVVLACFQQHGKTLHLAFWEILKIYMFNGLHYFISVASPREVAMKYAQSQDSYAKDRH